jgi:hypothetical protein
MAQHFSGPGSVAAALGSRQLQATAPAPQPQPRPAVIHQLADLDQAPASVHDQLAAHDGRLAALEQLHGPYRESHPAGHFVHPDAEG